MLPVIHILMECQLKNSEGLSEKNTIKITYKVKNSIYMYICAYAYITEYFELW